jgi:hypothetical protein
VLICNSRVPQVEDAEAWSDEDRTVGFLEAHGARRSTNDPAHLQYVMPFGVAQLLVDIRRFDRSEASGFTIATFGDLVSGGPKLEEALSREVYRCRWLGRPLTLIVLQTDADLGPLLSRVPELRTALGPGTICDLLEGCALALVLPGREPREALREARRLPGLSRVDGLEIGWSSLGGGGGSPEELIQQALAGVRPAVDLLAPRLLVFDRYGAIVDTIEMVIGERFHVDKTTEAEMAEGLLEKTPYDGLVAEWEPDDGDRGRRLFEMADRFHPGIRKIVTTTRFDLRTGGQPVPEDASIVVKPFTLQGLRGALKGLLKD